MDSKLDEQLDSKRETLLTRRGHLIRILSIVLLFLSAIFVLISVGLPEVTGFIGFFTLYFSVFLFLALLFSIFASGVICLGALIAHKFVLEEYENVFYRGEPIKEIGGYKNAMKEADELIIVYDDTEEKIFEIFAIWGVIGILFFAVVFLLIMVEELLGQERIVEIMEMYEAAFDISLSVLVLFPILLSALYSFYVSRTAMNSEAGDHLREWIYDILPNKVYILIMSLVSLLAILILTIIS